MTSGVRSSQSDQQNAQYDAILPRRRASNFCDARSTSENFGDVQSRITDLHIDDIRSDDVCLWIDELRAKRYAPGKGKSTKRKGPKGWAYSKSTVRGYYRVLRTIIGHATEAMTHHYSHVGEDEMREAVARVFAIVNGDQRVVSRVVDGAGPDDQAAEVTELVGGATQI